jgi:hypothetical protein
MRIFVGKSVRIMKFTLILFLVSFSSQLFAGDKVFTCTVESLDGLGDDGKIEPQPEVFQQLFVGEKFVIDRATGSVVGERISSRNADIGPVVAAHGKQDRRDSTNNWQVYWVVKGSATDVVNTIIVREQVESEKKPMIYVQHSQLATGYCI